MASVNDDGWGGRQGQSARMSVVGEEGFAAVSGRPNGAIVCGAKIRDDAAGGGPFYGQRNVTAVGNANHW